MKGKLYGLGVGPGDPQLLTLRAYHLLQQVPIICAPKAREDKASQALEIVRAFIPPQAQVLELLLPMTRDRTEVARAHRQAVETLYPHLAAGKDAAFLTLGDPSCYSTFSYLVKSLQEHDPEIHVETVPGVTSFSAAAAKANLALALGDEPLTILPSTTNKGCLEDFLAMSPNLVLLKAGGSLERVADLLAQKGRRALLARRVGMAGEEVTSQLDQYRETDPGYFTLLVIKEGEGQ